MDSYIKNKQFRLLFHKASITYHKDKNIELFKKENSHNLIVPYSGH